MSTAKSMASSYLNGKRAGRAPASTTTTLTQHRFKSSASNLSSANTTAKNNVGKLTSTSARAKSTSMTNLVASNHQELLQNSSKQAQIQRPASRNALDSIHNGMNAKYAQVQSKIPATTKKAATLSRAANGIHVPGAGGAKTSASGQAAALQARLGQLEEQLRQVEAEAESRRQELERERQDRQEQVSKLKLELEEKASELERQSEEQHRKLLEAYELADQNRRSADLVLVESRQRDEESRKKRQELEQQLQELREFVQVKEEMAGKMVELREQLREERERYEQQLANLRQMFENEKISKDENSNYFSRQKAQLTADSTDSINVENNVAQLGLAGGCRKCRTGRSQLHRSEQDMYGSRMSTRVQESARSAWRASKQFASSVITGGVSLSACRQLKRSKKSKKKEAAEEVTQHQLPLPPPRSPRAERRVEQMAIGKEEQTELGLNCTKEEEELHTSVVRVEVAHQQPQASRGRDEEEEEVVVESKEAEAARQIHVDPQSNKLTIVTKFTAPSSSSPPSSSSSSSSPSVSREHQQSPESGSSSSSERSRCESSSSGRGTSAASDDANSTGDLPEVSQVSGGSKLATAETNKKQTSEDKSPVERRHRRRSSLFKASKVFGAGSQTSLNKLKSFFAISSSASADISAKNDAEITLKNEAPEVVAPMEHLESSRRRCLELARLATESQRQQQQAQAQEVGQGAAPLP